MGDVLDFSGGTKADIPVEEVLDVAKKLNMVAIMGYTEDGIEYFASSSGSYQENAWLAGRFIKFLMENIDE